MHHVIHMHTTSTCTPCRYANHPHPLATYQVSHLVGDQIVQAVPCDNVDTEMQVACAHAARSVQPGWPLGHTGCVCSVGMLHMAAWWWCRGGVTHPVIAVQGGVHGE